MLHAGAPPATGEQDGAEGHGQDLPSSKVGVDNQEAKNSLAKALHEKGLSIYVGNIQILHQNKTNFNICIVYFCLS